MGSRLTSLVAVFVGLLVMAGAGSADTKTAADLSLTLTGPTIESVGDLTYTAVITNNGPDDAVGLMLNVSVPHNPFGGLGFVSADSPCSGQLLNNLDTESCPFNGDLASGSALTVHLTYQVVAEASLTLSANVGLTSNTQTDPDPTNNAEELQLLAPADINNTALPTLSGSTAVGSVLTVSTGDWMPNWPYTFTYHWNRCIVGGSCQTLDGGSTYSVTTADSGCTLQVIVTASAGPASVNAASSPSSPVPGGPCTLSTSPASTAPTAPTTPVAWVTKTLPHAVEGQGYLEPLLVNPPDGLEFEVAGLIPRGFTITPDGELTGRAAFIGTYTFTVGARLDGYAYNDHEFTLVIDAPRQITATPQVRAIPKLTPGARNPTVRQSTIGSTICSATWLRRQQPTAAYLQMLKQQQMRRYHDPGNAANYTEDHLIPVNLGGAARNPANLWPELTTKATASDRLEQQLNHRVCRLALTLRAAQQQVIRSKRAAG